MTTHEVLVVGGGPVGLLTAAELALAGVDVAVLERRTEPDRTIKAGSVVPSAVQALDRRGLLERGLDVQQRFLATLRRPSGPSGPRFAGHLAGLPLRADLVDLPDDGSGPVPFLLAIPQHELESILHEHAVALGVEIVAGVSTTGVVDDGSVVTVSTDHGPWTARWVVGADGGRSVVRRSIGVGFPGTDPEITGRQALVDLADTDDLELGWQYGPRGVWCVGPQPGRILTVEFDGPPADRETPVTAEELEKSLRHVSGSRVRVTAVHSATRWTDNTRQVDAYRRGRVLLAGDAAHVHPPFGGQGLGLGISDAMNLGWKLAAVVLGHEPETLLDTYDAERRPAAAAVLDLTRAQVALMRPDPRTAALRRYVRDAFDTRAGASAAARLLAGPEVHAPIAQPGDDPLVGHLAPDLVLDDGRRLAEVARDGRWTRVVTADGPASDERTTVVRGPRDLLVRPDGVCAPRS